MELVCNCFKYVVIVWCNVFQFEKVIGGKFFDRLYKCWYIYELINFFIWKISIKILDIIFLFINYYVKKKNYIVILKI